MRARIERNCKLFTIDCEKPIDISIPLIPNRRGPNCFYAPTFKALPYQRGEFIGAVKKGGSVNFYNLQINPHGNGTHTECMGHINEEQTALRTVFKENFFLAHLISIYPQKMDGDDRGINRHNLEILLDGVEVPEALIIRTLPNGEEKKQKIYSGNNPPFFTADAMKFIVEIGVRHLLVDLPSVDREEDGGKLTAHKIFWHFSGKIRTDCTITELIYVENSIKDGNYFLNLQRLNIELDASPSRPVIFKIVEETL